MERAACLTNCIITIKTYFNDSTLRYTGTARSSKVKSIWRIRKADTHKAKTDTLVSKKKKKKNKAAGIETVETGESFRK